MLRTAREVIAETIAEDIERAGDDFTNPASAVVPDNITHALNMAGFVIVPKEPGDKELEALASNVVSPMARDMSDEIRPGVWRPHPDYVEEFRKQYRAVIAAAANDEAAK